MMGKKTHVGKRRDDEDPRRTASRTLATPSSRTSSYGAVDRDATPLRDLNPLDTSGEAAPASVRPAGVTETSMLLAAPTASASTPLLLGPSKTDYRYSIQASDHTRPETDWHFQVKKNQDEVIFSHDFKDSLTGNERCLLIARALAEQNLKPEDVEVTLPSNAGDDGNWYIVSIKPGRALADRSRLSISIKEGIASLGNGIYTLFASLYSSLLAKENTGPYGGWLGFLTSLFCNLQISWDFAKKFFLILAAIGTAYEFDNLQFLIFVPVSLVLSMLTAVPAIAMASDAINDSNFGSAIGRGGKALFVGASFINVLTTRFVGSFALLSLIAFYGCNQFLLSDDERFIEQIVSDLETHGVLFEYQGASNREGLFNALKHFYQNVRIRPRSSRYLEYALRFLLRRFGGLLSLQATMVFQEKSYIGWDKVGSANNVLALFSALPNVCFYRSMVNSFDRVIASTFERSNEYWRMDRALFAVNYLLLTAAVIFFFCSGAGMGREQNKVLTEPELESSWAMDMRSVFEYFSVNFLKYAMMIIAGIYINLAAALNSLDRRQRPPVSVATNMNMGKLEEAWREKLIGAAATNAHIREVGDDLQVLNEGLSQEALVNALTPPMHMNDMVAALEKQSRGKECVLTSEQIQELREYRRSLECQYEQESPLMAWSIFSDSVDEVEQGLLGSLAGTPLSVNNDDSDSDDEAATFVSAANG